MVLYELREAWARFKPSIHKFTKLRRGFSQHSVIVCKCLTRPGVVELVAVKGINNQHQLFYSRQVFPYEFPCMNRFVQVRELLATPALNDPTP